MSGFKQCISSLSDKNGKGILPIIEDMHSRKQSVLICNLGADDNDAQINAHLLLAHRDLLVAGLIMLSQASCCSEVIVYSGELNTDALSEDLSRQLLMPVTVKIGPSSPVLREPTALYSVLETGVIRCAPAELAYKRDYLSFGYQGRPTMVVDGETVYQAARLAEDRQYPMTKHIAVIKNGSFMKEVVVGSPVRELLEGVEIVKPVLLGGTRGSFLSTEELAQMPISFSYSCDSIRIYSATECVVTEMAHHYQRIRELSCAKCVLCREGSWQLHTIFSDMTKGRGNRDDLSLIEDICPLIQAGALCDFGRNMALPALTAATVCRDALQQHIIGQLCSAGQCQGLLNYVIDPTLCTGCGDCLEACPEEAIEGKNGFIHLIDEKFCEKCGKCVALCSVGAIKFGGEKIKVPRNLVRVGRFH